MGRKLLQGDQAAAGEGSGEKSFSERDFQGSRKEGFVPKTGESVLNAHRRRLKLIGSVWGKRQKKSRTAEKIQKHHLAPASAKGGIHPRK